MSAPTTTRPVHRCTDHRHNGHHGSHAECYAAGLHDNSKAGRERCRLGSRKIHAVVPVAVNLKSKNSNVVHGPGDNGQATRCASSGWMTMQKVNSPVTCKRCLKLASA